MQPETRYTKSGDVNIAYQVCGDGSVDLVVIPIWVSHLEYAWEEPGLARFYRRLASFSRLAALFAATYPERTIALTTFGMFARRLRSPEYSWGWVPERRQAWLEEIESEWGGPVGLAEVAPSVAGDERFERWWATYLIVENTR